ncbi:hydroxyethylthiazole kinase [Clostridia bacterium]|nr:hydroxyethylthiazole kinase [Clostridia bacterium]
MLGKYLENVRTTAPLIHNITNYVTVNDCANILLACGASPIMADDPDEAADITAICGGLVINIGTLNKNTIPSMFAAGRQANALKHPVILDPVGAGASPLRTNTAKKLLEEIQFTVIRGNISEIKALALGSGGARGVDADVADAITEETLDSTIEFAKHFSKKTGAIIVITGVIDIVTDADNVYVIRNGHPLMSRITGSGCMLTCLIGAYIAANPDDCSGATAAAVCAMGLCGERAAARLADSEGNSTYRNYLIDEIFRLDSKLLDAGANSENR